MDQHSILFYAQKGVRERLSDAAALMRSGIEPEWLGQVVADAQEIARYCRDAQVPIQPAFVRALTRVGGEL